MYWSTARTGRSAPARFEVVVGVPLRATSPAAFRRVAVLGAGFFAVFFAVDFFAAVFFAEDFFAVAFFAAVLFAAVLFAAVLFAAVLFAEVFFAVFFAAVFFAEDFFAVFFAEDFFAVFFAEVFFAVFFAAVFFAAVFLAVVFFELLAVFLDAADRDLAAAGVRLRCAMFVTVRATLRSTTAGSPPERDARTSHVARVTEPGMPPRR